jgi:fatty-acyl-CoA synthase
MAMMDVPLNSWLLFGHAPRYFPDTEVVTRFGNGRLHRYTYPTPDARPGLTGPGA